MVTPTFSGDCLFMAAQRGQLQRAPLDVLKASRGRHGGERDVRRLFGRPLVAGFVPGPQAAWWGRERLCIECEWPELLVDLDLRYWADPKSCDGQTRPSTRQLAATWGWTKSRADRYIKRDSCGTVAGHPTPKKRPQ